jgi:hypothetical protein
MNSPDLPNVVWIGGSPCAGKSSIADAIARERGWSVYRCDDEVTRHAQLADPLRQPVFTRLNRLSCDELWLRPLDEQVSEEFAFYREEFPFILDDLARFPAGQTVLAEGAALLPELIDPAVVAQGRAVWIVPTAAFQLEYYGKRAWPADTLAGCTDHAAAWANWMERDIRFARAVAASAHALSYPLLLVDGPTSLEENIATVDRLLTYPAR